MLSQAGYGTITEIYEWDYTTLLLAQYSYEKKNIDCAIESEGLSNGQ